MNTGRTNSYLDHLKAVKYIANISLKDYWLFDNVLLYS